MKEPAIFKYRVSCIGCGKAFEWPQKLDQHLRLMRRPLWLRALNKRLLAIKKVAAKSGLLLKGVSYNEYVRKIRSNPRINP
jgi:hypothetical protein